MRSVDQAHLQIQKAEDKIRGNTFETGILFDTQGNVVWEKEGSNNKVSFTRMEIESMYGKIVSHNHPDYSPPSPNDLYMLWQSEAIELRACNEYGSYVMKAPLHWKEEPEDFHSLCEDFWNANERIGLQYRDIAASEGKSIVDYLDEIHEETIRELCKKYGIAFEWEARHEE